MPTERHGKIQLLQNSRPRTQRNHRNPQIQRTTTKEKHAKQNHDPQTPKIQNSTHDPTRNVSIRNSHKKHPIRSCQLPHQHDEHHTKRGIKRDKTSVEEKQ